MSCCRGSSPVEAIPPDGTSLMTVASSATMLAHAQARLLGQNSRRLRSHPGLRQLGVQTAGWVRVSAGGAPGVSSDTQSRGARESFPRRWHCAPRRSHRPPPRIARAGESLLQHLAHEYRGIESSIDIRYGSASTPWHWCASAAARRCAHGSRYETRHHVAVDKSMMSAQRGGARKSGFHRQNRGRREPLSKPDAGGCPRRHRGKVPA